METIIRAEWGYDCYFSSFNSRSRGVCCLIKPNFEHKINRVRGDIGGEFSCFRPFYSRHRHDTYKYIWT